MIRPKAVLLLLALLLALFILWKTLLKPQVESAARAVAVEEVEEVEEQVAELEDEVEEVAEVADVAQDAAEEAEETAVEAEEAAAAAEEAAGGGGGGGDSGLGTIFNETSAPSNARLTVTADPGATQTTGGGTLPADSTFALTDVILQNPGGAVGRIRIQLGGETILESALENFRDLDFHFVSPYIVEGGQELALEIDCAADQIVAGTPCEAAVSFAGFTTETVASS